MAYPALRLPDDPPYDPRAAAVAELFPRRSFRTLVPPAPASAPGGLAPLADPASGRAAAVAGLFPEKPYTSLQPAMRSSLPEVRVTPGAQEQPMATRASTLQVPGVPALPARVNPAAPTPAPETPAKSGFQLPKVDAMGVVNAGLGLAGLLSYATAKAPKLAPPPAYTPRIRPAEGMGYERLQAGRNQLQAAQRLAGRPTGADAATGAAVRLAALAQTQQAQNQLTQQDADIYRQDRQREGQEQTQAYDSNYRTQRSYEEALFNQQNTAYQARRQQGAAQAQSALTYLAQSSANKQQALEAVKNQQNRYKELELQTLLSRKADSTLTAEQRAEAERQITLLIGAGKTSTTYARGGKVASGGSTSLSTKTAGSGAQHAEALFQRAMAQVTQQAMRAFSQSIAQAFQAKYQPAFGARRR